MAVGTYLYGRRMYETMLYWEHPAEQPGCYQHEHEPVPGPNPAEDRSHQEAQHRDGGARAWPPAVPDPVQARASGQNRKGGRQLGRARPIGSYGALHIDGKHRHGLHEWRRIQSTRQAGDCGHIGGAA
jgi:hypothetical protein